MRKYLLPKEGKFYKANLHCHSTISDGSLTPEEIKQVYQQHGYSIVAYTDHDVLISHSDLTDDNFLALNGFEIGINDINAPSYVEGQTVHICLISLSQDNLIHPVWHRTKYLFANAVNYRNKVQYDENKPDFEKEYTPECVNKIISEGRNNGFFVTYNHPVWSMENYKTYSLYHGMHAIEICNYSSLVGGYDECVPHIYDDMLREGEKIFCIATDDNHNIQPLNSRRSDSFGAFTMIKAERLDYPSIANALINGHFYASQGPEIYELYYENERVYLTCSNADCISMNVGVRHAVAVFDESGSGITKAVFDVDTPIVNYVRFSVTDKYGKKAYTNAYFYKDFVDANETES